MSKPLSPLRRFLAAFASSLEPKPAAVIYTLGVIAWVLGMFLLGMQSSESNLFYALIEDTRSIWQTAFLWSVAVVAVASLVYCAKARRSLLTAVSNTVVYTSPYALFLLGVWTLDAFYAQHPATVETTSILGPIFVIFYVIGILYMWARAPKGRDEALPFFILPTFTVVILLIGMTAYKLFTSTDYIYRDAFRLIVQSVDRKGETVKVRGTLTLNKAGDYKYVAISNEMAPYPADMPQPIKVAWDNGGAEPATEGEYGFSLDLPKSQPSRRTAWTPAGTDPSAPGFSGPEVYFQISLRSAGPDNARALLKSMPVWLDEFMPQ